MKVKTSLTIGVALWCCAALAACASTGTQEYASGDATRALPQPANAATTVPSLAGQYAGTFTVHGAKVGKAYFDLTQGGKAVGGTLKLVLSSGTLHEPAAMTLNARDNTLTGTAVDIEGKTPCTYALDGSYNPKNGVLAGKSSPLTCTGKVAKFSAVERCFYNTGTNGAARPDSSGILECSKR